MPIASFLSDYGLADHYVAAVKARVLKDCPQATIVDITHQISNGNIAQAGFNLRSVFHDFPKGTVHLVAVGAASDKRERFLALALEGHYFVGPDTGIWSLISTQEPTECIVLPHVNELNSSFPGKYVLAPAVAELLNGTALEDLGEPCVDEIERKLFRKAMVSENAIQGHVIHIDHYGNLITNIDGKTFRDFGNERKFSIRFGYERFYNIQKYYNSKEYGDCVILFNSQDLLEVAINQGNASELMGLNLNSHIVIEFEPKAKAIAKEQS